MLDALDTPFRPGDGPPALRDRPIATRDEGSPFDLSLEGTYSRWRARRLSAAPRSAAELIVDVADPGALTPGEHAALAQRIARANMAIYRSVPARDVHASRQQVQALARRFGLLRLDANWLADEDGLSPITVRAARHGEGAGAFIPYTDRAIRWHTDGYYHPAGRAIRGMVLHCVEPAALGGGTALLDPELAYIALRDADPAHVAALMAPDAMTIPPRTDDTGIARAAQTGPVFSVDAAGALHLRYTARTRSIVWRDDAATRAAVQCLERILADSAQVLRVRLAAGMGLLSNNVLHDREAFVDDPARPRLLIRARYLDRIEFPAAAVW
jgi:Taurine catabolism dioxygenase TauD, TfdA family